MIISVNVCSAMHFSQMFLFFPNTIFKETTHHMKQYRFIVYCKSLCIEFKFILVIDRKFILNNSS